MKAPALEKGLDILETLVQQSDALTSTQIANRCGRSLSEIQRMVHVLQRRGYLDRTGAGAYRPGLQLYELGRFRHPFRNFQTVAEPRMAELAACIGQSIHLSVEDRGQMLILSEILGRGLASVSLQLGSRHALESTLSGRILLLNHKGESRPADRRQIEQAGFLTLPSSLYSGVQDFGVPIRRESDGWIVATLACSCLKERKKPIQSADLAEALSKTAGEIAASLQSLS